MRPCTPRIAGRFACSAGHGAKGRRLYDWTRIELASPATSTMARWLLVCKPGLVLAWSRWRRRHQARARRAHYQRREPQR